MSTTVTLRPMQPDEFDEYTDGRYRSYVEELSATMSPEAARRKVSGEHHRFLPQGLTTQGHRFLLAEDAEGEVVGAIWLGLTDPISGCPESAWLFHIQVEPSRRRSGYATAMLQGVESLVRGLGIDHLGLSVDSTNAAALALYEATGYVVAAQQMSKRLHGT